MNDFFDMTFCEQSYGMGMGFCKDGCEEVCFKRLGNENAFTEDSIKIIYIITFCEDNFFDMTFCEQIRGNWLL